MLSIGAIAAKVFGTSNDRRLKVYRPRVEAINALEPEVERLSDAELIGRTEAFRKQLADGAELDDASPYARVVYVFDGRDEAAVAQARAEWQKAKTHGFSVSYWQQDSEGRWQQKA